MISKVKGLIVLSVILGAEALRAGKNNEDSPQQVLRQRNLQDGDSPVDDSLNLFVGQCGLTLGATDEACAALAATTTEVCDCYTFCDGELILCDSFGEPTAFKCTAEEVVAGCTGPIMAKEPEEDMGMDMGMEPEEDAGMLPDDTMVNATNTTFME